MPHAPWTPNWIKNAPAARAPKLLGKIQSGIQQPIERVKMMIVNRRPSLWESQPAKTPPAIAPQFPIMVATVAVYAEKPLLVFI